MIRLLFKMIPVNQLCNSEFSISMIFHVALWKFRLRCDEQLEAPATSHFKTTWIVHEPYLECESIALLCRSFSDNLVLLFLLIVVLFGHAMFTHRTAPSAETKSKIHSNGLGNSIMRRSFPRRLLKQREIGTLRLIKAPNLFGIMRLRHRASCTGENFQFSFAFYP